MGWGSAGQGRAGQGGAVLGGAGQCETGQGWTGQESAKWGNADGRVRASHLGYFFTHLYRSLEPAVGHASTA